MAEQNPSPWPIVCAIDFGTTYSGYAYSVRADYEVNPLKVETIPWKNNLQASKTSTCILFDNFGNFHSFGYDAEKQYITLADRAQQNMMNDENDDNNDEKESAIKHTVEEEDTFGDWLYFKSFKMKLFQDSSIMSQNFTTMNLEAENGVKFPALKVFSEAIKFFKNHFENELENSMLSETSTTSVSSKAVSNQTSWSNDILWVLTVPAIWSDQAKQFMREAAIQAGIKDEQLILALEPECAALLCKHLALTKKADERYVRTFDPGSKFMVVDCGGGTVDVTVYVVNENRSLKELHCATGDAVGGTNVDKLFLDLLTEIYGKTVLTRFKEKSPWDWQELFRTFEYKKRDLGPENSNHPIIISNLGELSNEFLSGNRNSGKTVPMRLKEMGFNREIRELNKSKLNIDKSYFIEKLFMRPVNDIVTHLKVLFEKHDVSSVNNILLVGGFSECILLQNAIQREFPDKEVRTPREGSNAVLKGAVLFGHSPESLSKKQLELGYPVQEKLENRLDSFTRKSRAYYGVATDVPFNEKKHPSANKIFKDGINMCSDIFDCLIKKNQDLERGKSVIEKTFRVSSSSVANVEIYRSEEEVEYCHDDRCKRIGQIIAFSKTVELRDERLLSVQLHFGFTEKIVIVKDLSTNETWRARLNCFL